MDGTLLDTLGDIAAAHNHTLRVFGFPEREINDFNTIIGQDITEAIKKRHPLTLLRRLLPTLTRCIRNTTPGTVWNSRSLMKAWLKP